MKIGFSLLFIFGFINLLTAQITPQPSPGASISQTIGVTEIYLEFSRPSAKGRKVFGELVPFQSVWRTGANASTKIEITNEVEIEGQTILPGVYAIMTKPGVENWEVYLFQDLEITEESFESSYPEYSFNTSAEKIPYTETFTIFFSDITDETSKLHIQWETTEIILSIRVNNILPVTESIDLRINEMAGNLQQAAEYLLNKNADLELAMKYIDQSIFLSETFRNNWIKAQILYSMGKYKLSLQSTLKAKELGEGDPVYEFFNNTIEATILDLKSKTL